MEAGVGIGHGSTPNLLVFALVLIVVPGPSVLFVVGRTLALGRRGGLLSMAGNALGQLLQVAAVALGIGVVLAQSLLLFAVVKFAGAAYLICLGVQTIRHRAGNLAAADPSWPAPASRILREGVIVGATNPKSIVFFVAVLPQFVDYSAGAIPLQLGMPGAVFLLFALVSDSAWALTAGTARHWFAGSPKPAKASAPWVPGPRQYTGPGRAATAYPAHPAGRGGRRRRPRTP